MLKTENAVVRENGNWFVKKNGRYDIGIGLYTPDSKKGGDEEPKTFVSMRLWTVDREGKHLPTREGFVFDKETLPDIISALTELHTELK